MEIQTSGGEIIGILKKLKDDMSADLADPQKADGEASKASKANHATLVAAKENELKIQRDVASSEIWLREDLERVYAVLFRNVGIGTGLALCSVGWLTTREFVILVSDPIIFTPRCGAADVSLVTAVMTRHTKPPSENQQE